MSIRLVTLAALLASSAALTGCGKSGALERPGPMFGATRPDGPDATVRKDERDPTRPVRTIDSRRDTTTLDDATNPGPARSNPIGGANPTATDAPPQGVFPNPYDEPRR